MSIFTREVFASAASSPHGLNVGTVADPVRLTWREVHEQAKQMTFWLITFKHDLKRLLRGIEKLEKGLRELKHGAEKLDAGADRV